MLKFLGYKSYALFLGLNEAYQCVLEFLLVINPINSISTSLIKIPIIINISHTKTLYKPKMNDN